MTINTDLLVAAPMLQDYLVDKDTGLPLVQGIVTLYKDNARSFYKNWYYQAGSPGAYTWVALDNPLQLSSVGTIQDPNGNDVIPFYYPYEENNENQPEKYYITVYSADENGEPDVLQFTRENFPFLPSNVSPTATNPTWRNYILNNIYWRNIGSLDAMNVTDQVIAPSQHDGYTNGDIRFIKNTTGANDDLAFLPMTSTLNNDITPEYYINFTCTGTQSGETQKCIQYPISLHVKTLQNVQASVVFQGQNVAGNTNNYVDLYIYQFLGTGALAQPDPILIQRVTLGNTFQKFIIPFIFPDAAGLTLGLGGDDALFLQVQYPLSSLCQINHTKPQIYLSTDVPDNDFDTYDQIETIINSPRTGDIRTSLNTFQPFGYVPMNDGTICNAGSITAPVRVGFSRQNIDTWPLFNLIWNAFKAFDVAGVNPLAQIYDSAGATAAYGANAITDWNANKQIALTKMLGKVMLGTAPVAALPASSSTTFVAVNGGGNLQLNMAVNVNYFDGMPIYFTNTGGALPIGLTAGVIYYVANFNGSSIFNVSNSYANYLAGTLVAYTDAGTGVHTAVAEIAGSMTGEYQHTQLATEVGTHTHDGNPGFSYLENKSASGSFNISTVGGNDNDLFTTTGNNTGTSGQPFNVMQPGTFYNMFMKL